MIFPLLKGKRALYRIDRYAVCRSTITVMCRMRRTSKLLGSATRQDQDAAQSERVALAYRRLANAMILSTLREISKTDVVDEIDEDALEISFVESRRIDPWCELAGIEPEVVRRAARRLVDEEPF